MNHEDFCSYELSKALKAAGFDEPCEAFYLPPMKNRPEPFFSGRVKRSIKNETHAFHLSAPSLYHAQKWLREKHHISIRVSYIAYHKVWFADWLNLDSGEFDDTDATFDSYEEALADGISVVLELIKKGE